MSTFYLNKATETHSVNSPFCYHLIKMECQFGWDPIMGYIFTEFNEFYEEDSLKYRSFTFYKHVLNICILTDTICPPPLPPALSSARN